MKQSLSLLVLEEELKKVWEKGYGWGGKKQNNRDDGKTRFVYDSPFFDETWKQVAMLPVELRQYALSRWYNFWSAKGVEAIFSQHANVSSVQNVKDPQKDFYISGVPFDHKTTVFPKGFGQTIVYAKENPEKLVQWLYKNQSQQQRKHFHNRFFVVVYDEKGGEHWKVKAELRLLHEMIHTSLLSFSLQKCISFSLNGEMRYAGVIFVSRPHTS